MKKPLVSILIPTYNQPDFFRQSLESALSQDYPEIEIVVSDDSTDDRVEKIASEYKDRIRFLKHDTRGISIGDRVVANLENLLENSSGDFINILYHDDLIYPNKISTMMYYFSFDEENKIALVSSVRDAVDADGKIFMTLDTLAAKNLYTDKTDLLFDGEEVGRLILRTCGNFVGELSTVLIRREDFYRSCVRKLSPGYCFGVRDRTMWDVSTYLEACRDGRGLIFLRKPLSAFRLSNGSQNTNNSSVRIDIIVDWLAIATACYLRNFYLYTRNDFEVACECWYSMVRGMAGFLQQKDIRELSIKIDVLDQILRAAESVENRDYDGAFKIGIDWILQHSSNTFDVYKYIYKKFGGGRDGSNNNCAR